jgi:hypothetical protein
MRGVIFPEAVRVRLDPDLRAGLLKLAETERSTLSEATRRLLRTALADRERGATEPVRSRAA